LTGNLSLAIILIIAPEEARSFTIGSDKHF
jgi:hypothetical protein